MHSLNYHHHQDTDHPPSTRSTLLGHWVIPLSLGGQPLSRDTEWLVFPGCHQACLAAISESHGLPGFGHRLFHYAQCCLHSPLSCSLFFKKVYLFSQKSRFTHKKGAIEILLSLPGPQHWAFDLVASESPGRFEHAALWNCCIWKWLLCIPKQQSAVWVRGSPAAANLRYWAGLLGTVFGKQASLSLQWVLSRAPAGLPGAVRLAMSIVKASTTMGFLPRPSQEAGDSVLWF